MNRAKSRTVSFIALTTCLIFASATNAKVETVSKSYPCCGSPEIKVNDGENCDQSWEIADVVIASYDRDQLAHPAGCKAPCSNVSIGKLIMDRCLSVRHRMVCPGSDGKVKETITNYTANTDNCPVTPEEIVKSVTTNHHNQSPRHHYWLLAAVLLVVFAVIGIVLWAREGEVR